MHRCGSVVSRLAALSVIPSLACAAAAVGRRAMSTRTHKLSEEGTTLILTPAKAKHTASVILMHGLGDSAEGWIDTAAESLAPAVPHAKFILPTAKVQPVTINGGAPMPSWYDIESLGGHRKLEKCAGIDDSVKRVRALMQQEVDTGIPLDRIVLAGFSQGGAMSLYTGLNTPATLAGIVVMSGYMPLPDKIAPTAAALATPVFQAHGDEDMVVRLDWAADARDRLKALGVKSQAFKVYEGLPHSVALEELRDVIAFLRKVLPAEVPAAKPAAAAATGSSAAVEVAASGATTAATGGSGSA